MIWFALLLLLQDDPDQARFAQAQLLAAQGRCAEADPDFQQLAAAHPGLAAIPFALGQCEFDAKTIWPPSTAFGRVLADRSADGGSAGACYGAALGLSGRTAEAIVQLREAMRANNDFAAEFPAARHVRGRAMVRRGPRSHSALERAVTLEASDARAHYWLGQLHFLNKDYDASAKEFAASLACAATIGAGAGRPCPRARRRGPD